MGGITRGIVHVMEVFGLELCPCLTVFSHHGETRCLQYFLHSRCCVCMCVCVCERERERSEEREEVCLRPLTLAH